MGFSPPAGVRGTRCPGNRTVGVISPSDGEMARERSPARDATVSRAKNPGYMRQVIVDMDLDFFVAPVH